MSDFPGVRPSSGAATQIQARRRKCLRACFKNTRGSAARDFGRSLGGEARESPKRALSAEPTTAAAKRPAARRVFAPKALWLRCSSVEDPPGIFSFVESEQIKSCPASRAARHRAFGAKTEPLVFSKHALRQTVTAIHASRCWSRPVTHCHGKKKWKNGCFLSAASAPLREHAFSIPINSDVVSLPGVGFYRAEPKRPQRKANQ